MKEKVRFWVMDIHAEIIAVAEPNGEGRSLGTIANGAESILKLVKKPGSVEQLRAATKQGPAGDVLYWKLTELGVECKVIVPALMAMKAADRVMTGRRERLARIFQ